MMMPIPVNVKIDPATLVDMLVAIPSPQIQHKNGVVSANEHPVVKTLRNISVRVLQKITALRAELLELGDKLKATEAARDRAITRIEQLAEENGKLQSSLERERRIQAAMAENSARLRSENSQLKTDNAELRERIASMAMDLGFATNANITLKAQIAHISDN